MSKLVCVISPTHPIIRPAIEPFGNNIGFSCQIMAAINSSQAQVDASALLPDTNNPPPTKNLMGDHAEKSRYFVPYLLEKSPEFRELSDLRQQVSHTELGYYTYMTLTMLLIGMGNPGRR